MGSFAVQALSRGSRSRPWIAATAISTLVLVLLLGLGLILQQILREKPPGNLNPPPLVVQSPPPQVSVTTPLQVVVVKEQTPVNPEGPPRSPTGDTKGSAAVPTSKPPEKIVPPPPKKPEPEPAPLLASADDLKKVEVQIECRDLAEARKQLGELRSRCAADPAPYFYDAVAAFLSVSPPSWTGEPKTLMDRGRELEAKAGPAPDHERMDSLLKNCLLPYLEPADKKTFQDLLGRCIE